MLGDRQSDKRTPLSLPPPSLTLWDSERDIRRFSADRAATEMKATPPRRGRTGDEPRFSHTPAAAQPDFLSEEARKPRTRESPVTCSRLHPHRFKAGSVMGSTDGASTDSRLPISPGRLRPPPPLFTVFHTFLSASPRWECSRVSESLRSEQLTLPPNDQSKKKSQQAERRWLLTTGLQLRFVQLLAQCGCGPLLPS